MGDLETKGRVCAEVRMKSGRGRDFLTVRATGRDEHASEMISYAVMANVSIAGRFLAGVLPGVTFGVVLTSLHLLSHGERRVVDGPGAERMGGTDADRKVCY